MPIIYYPRCAEMTNLRYYVHPAPRISFALPYFLPICSPQRERKTTYQPPFPPDPVKGEGYKLNLIDASSGFHSLVPLFLVSSYLSQSIKEQANNSNKMSSDETRRFEEGVKSIWENPSFTDAQRRTALSVLSATFNKSAFINIVEEPEQNLFPSSQWEIMKSLLAINNSLTPNKLIITTHSPYLVNGFTIAVKVGILLSKVRDKVELNSVYPIESVIYPEDIVIYELDENNGTISELKNYNGLPSDENFLNELLEENNNLFANLIDIQQKL